jgi:tetratricopeptide (TPR) repeat protein
VASLLRQAAELEAQDRIDDALAAYRRVLALDPGSREARSGAARLDNRRQDEAFRDAMSAGLAALRAARHEEAVAAFRRAAQLRPDSAEPADGLAQVDLARRLAGVETLRNRGQAQLASEDWDGAIATFEQALAEDPSLQFAADGLALARDRSHLLAALQRHLDNPLAMRDADVLDAARRVLLQASAIESPGPVLAARIRDLAKRVRLARVPVQLQLISDNETEITIYKVGQLGLLQTRALDLYPGVYTIVGKRRGYRDVLQEVTLSAGSTVPAVDIRCTEKI